MGLFGCTTGLDRAHSLLLAGEDALNVSTHRELAGNARQWPAAQPSRGGYWLSGDSAWANQAFRILLAPRTQLT